jgi:myo-inositol-1-phosphate synthase
LKLLVNNFVGWQWFIFFLGNNGTTVTAGILANRLGLEWNTKEKKHKSDYIGSLTQSSTIKLGLDQEGKPVYIPFKNILLTP